MLLLEVYKMLRSLEDEIGKGCSTSISITPKDFDCPGLWIKVTYPSYWRPEYRYKILVTLQELKMWSLPDITAKIARDCKAKYKQENEKERRWR